MKQYLKIIWLLFFFLIVSCARSEQDFTKEDATLSDESEVRFSLTSSNAMVTKSQYQESDLKTIHNVWVLAVADDGFWRAKYYTESDFSRDGDSVTLPAMNFKVGSSVTFYVTANMGDLTDAATPGGVATPSGIEYMIPASVDFSASGMPMAAEPLTRTITANTSVSVLLEPLLARLSITIDKNGITDNTVADVLASGAIKVKHANRRLCPFGVSCVLSPEHMFSVVVDTENFSSSVSYDMTHPNVVLYVPENSMGELLGPGSYTQWDKGNQGAPGKQYATYIEYTGHKNAADDGIGGDLSYRAYLGENETSNYSVNRNTTYNCTLGLTWNGLFYTGDWRVDNSDITDGRLLTLSDTPHTTSSSFTDWGRLRRNVAKEVYVNFSRDGGASWVSSAKDIDCWPYGWDLYIDGVKQAAGAAATAAGDLGWAYTSATAGDQIAITPGPSSVASSVHTLQVKSADGRVVSNEVSFEVSQPLKLYWSNDADKYVAQMQRLSVTDRDESGLTITYTEKNGSDKLQFNGGTEEGVNVGLLAAGDYTIVATASNGQTGEVSFSVNNPVVEQLWTASPLWVDGTESARLLRYTTNEGTEMTVATSDSQGYGTKFAPSLYQTLLKPSITGVSPVGSYLFQSSLRNLVAMNDEDQLYVPTLKCTIPGDEIEVGSWVDRHFKVNVQAGVESFAYETSFKNPFADVDQTVYSGTFHDFTSLFDYITYTQQSAYNIQESYAFSSKTDGRIYADRNNVLVQTSKAVNDKLDAFKAFYYGDRMIRFSLAAGGFHHPSGKKSLYILVRNKYDVSAGGGRAKYCLSKQFGTAKIYLHVACTTIVRTQGSGEYIRMPWSSWTFSPKNAGDTWDQRYLFFGFVNNMEVMSNPEVMRLANHAYGSTAPLYKIRCLGNEMMAVSGLYGWTSSSGSTYTLEGAYGFVRSDDGSFLSDVVYPLGIAVICTKNSGGSSATGTWDGWKSYSDISPFLEYNSSFPYAQWTWSDRNGLSGRYFRDYDSELDGNSNGYVIFHFLQDLSRNTNNGYIEGKNYFDY